MGELIELAGRQFNSMKEVESFVQSAFLAVQASGQKIRKLEEEVKHLQDLLTSTSKLIDEQEDSKVESVIKSPAQIICEQQIERISALAIGRTLALEEVKALDLLVKNLMLLKGEATAINGAPRKKKPKVYTDGELVSIAKQIEDKSND